VKTEKEIFTEFDKGCFPELSYEETVEVKVEAKETGCDIGDLI